VSKDVTDQKKLELKSLKSNILGQDLERKRLASDLHDSLGQELGAIKFFLGSLKMMKEGSEEYTTCLEEIDRMVNDTINSVREITFDLMPFVLENNTLDKAIEQLCRKTNIIETIQVEFTKNTDTIQLKDKKEESFVYRIIQEFINNTIKHAHATKLIIDIQKHPNSIKFKLQDNGTGFKVLINNRKNGLLIISQRLEILQSEYQWQSDKSGTTLEFTLYE
jgi:signal transduction histidine kinase